MQTVFVVNEFNHEMSNETNAYPSYIFFSEEKAKQKAYSIIKDFIDNNPYVIDKEEFNNIKQQIKELAMRENYSECVDVWNNFAALDSLSLTFVYIFEKEVE